MTQKQGLLITQLILIGYRKNYTIPFFEGVNIIYGDIATGKSSILRLIKYLLGGNSIKVDTEITSSVKYAILEISVDGKKYCIQRDIYDSNRDVEVYSCPFDEIEDNFPEQLYAALKPREPGDEKKSLSEFLLELFNFPSAQLKQAPTKDSSKTARLSILDLFKYIYLNQDDVGSTRMLDIGTHFLEVKNREVLKYIFNVLDSNITDIDQEISEKTAEENYLKRQIEVILKFLEETQFDRTDSIQNQMTLIANQVSLLTENLSEIHSRVKNNDGFYLEMKGALEQINIEIKNKQYSRQEATNKLERYERLLNDYNNDLQKIKSSLKAQDLIGSEVEQKTLCPVCDSLVSIASLNEKFSISTEGQLKSELNSINRRVRDLVSAIDESRRKIAAYSSDLDELTEAQSRLRYALDEKLEHSISPYLIERDVIVGQLASLEERKAKYQQALKVRNRQNQIAEQVARLSNDINILKEKKKKLENEAPSMDKMRTEIGNSLFYYLSKIQLKNRPDVSIDHRTYLPVIKGDEYRNLSSGGVRTVVSIGYLASILRAKLSTDTNLPNLLMIDTVGKYLGKTGGGEFNSESDGLDVFAGVSDPEKYQNIYNYLFELAEEFKSQNKLCQIILVDNDLPSNNDFLDKNFGLTHFSTNGLNDLPIGLIDDWNSQSS